MFEKFCKKQNVKRYLLISTFYILIFTFYLTQAFVYAAEFDTSIDDEIRKNYNPDKIEEDMALPALPKILKDNTNNIKNIPDNTVKESPNDLQPIKKISNQVITPKNNSTNSYIVFKKGTKFKVKLLNNVSDNTKKSYKLSFVSLYPVSTTYLTIPAGTVFKGFIADSHKPQLTGNGGLIKIEINEMVLNGNVQPINAFVINANSKMIFFNNIKGKHKYISSMFKSIKPGQNFFKKMLGVTSYLAQDGSSIILTPFSLTAGILVLGGNVFISPALALFYKGENISINSDSHFVIKLAQDVYIYRYN